MKRTLCALSVVSLLLAACAGTRPAPVEDRTTAGTPPSSAATPPAVTGTPAAPAARSGFHIVSKGETLYGIALEYGQDWRDLVAWNKLDNPNLIRIGQELRVSPPEGTVETRPVLGAGAVESRPLDAPAAPAQQPAQAAPPDAANSAQLKREPRGGVEAYSEAALARLKGAPVVAAPATPTPPAPAPAATAAPAPTVPAAGAPDATRSEEGLDWSWPAQGRIIGRFGEGSNKGVDVGGKTGDPVLAAAGGRVVYAGEAMRGYGKLVIIKHDNTYLSAYAHNSKILVQERDSVKRGQKIAELGDTDTEAGKPRLHFEIRRQGKPVDPLKYLPPR
ncbi:peptidoglycan DD-metalloendopeptidase family protein [Methyloversatilis universalis]|uniref:peptidoglycan DD-metalloendopeptidase family protein n=1 Tax=Methyloversatilis universalis TaxID=378211 RepID=UPI00036AC8F1|nr:peptidoglycan DD-metalloendopeptidase family protein [Methyloversatilis universalis]